MENEPQHPLQFAMVDSSHDEIFDKLLLSTLPERTLERLMDLHKYREIIKMHPERSSTIYDAKDPATVFLCSQHAPLKSGS